MTREVAKSQAARMLTGAGLVEIAAYQLEPAPQFDVLAHGLDHLGRLIVACDLDSVAEFRDCPVRLTITVKAPEFSVNVVAASLHAVGNLIWEETIGPLRYAVVHTKRIFVEGAGSPIGFSYKEVLESAVDLAEIDTDALLARDIVGRLSQSELRQLAEGVRAKEILGVALKSGAEIAVGKRKNQVFIADISEFGVMLMEVRARCMQLALVRFPHRVRTFAELEGAVHDLAVLASVRN